MLFSEAEVMAKRMPKGSSVDLHPEEFCELVNSCQSLTLLSNNLHDKIHNPDIVKICGVIFRRGAFN